MSFPEQKPDPEKPKVSYVSKLVGPVTTTSFREVKNVDKSCYCLICKKTFTKMFSLQRHMQIHTGEKSYGEE